MYDTLSTVSTQIKSPKDSATSEPAADLVFSAEKCTKFIYAALSVNQKKTLPKLWNAFLLLGGLSDIQLVHRQLLACCKNEFYGNTNQIGSSVLPLLASIWDRLAADAKLKQELDHGKNCVKFIRNFKPSHSCCPIPTSR